MGIVFQIGMVVALCAALATGVAWFEHVLEDRGAQKIAVQQCVAGQESLQGAIADQNASIERLRTEGGEREKKAAVAIAAAKKEADGHAAFADHLLAQRAKGDVCVDAQALMSDYATKRQGAKP